MLLQHTRHVVELQDLAAKVLPRAIGMWNHPLPAWRLNLSRLILLIKNGKWSSPISAVHATTVDLTYRVAVRNWVSRSTTRISISLDSFLQVLRHLMGSQEK
jgi:hypothetical protein